MTSESTTTHFAALEPPYSHQVNAAWGWLELGNYDEAEAEVARLCDSVSLHPEVLMIRWEMCSQVGEWQEAFKIACILSDLCPGCPDSWIKVSFALHEMNRTQEAWDTLILVSPKFSQCPTVAYNLACYSCQLDRPDEAETWLLKAVKVGKKACIKKMALEDKDLLPMRDIVLRM